MPTSHSLSFIYKASKPFDKKKSIHCKAFSLFSDQEQIPVIYSEYLPI